MLEIKNNDIDAAAKILVIGVGGAGGDIVFFESEKGFGFIEPENGGKDVFVDQETISCK